MKVMLALCAILVVFALVFPVAAAWGGGADRGIPALPGAGDGQLEDKPPEEGEESGAPFYVEPEKAGGGDAGTVVNLLKDGQVVEISLRDYLVGALAAEMPASFEPEALKAQAVALRTYYLRKAETGSSAHPEAEICADSGCCAAYRDDEALKAKWGGDYGANREKIAAAVAETDGEYLTYEGKPALAVFHSSSAGRTEDSGEVWSGSEPYLVSVESPEGPEDVPDFVSTVTVSGEEFRETVGGKYPEAELEGELESVIGDAEYTDSGRLGSVVIGGARVTGTELRRLFGLRSTAVEIEVRDDSVVITSKGYGHGVGMSQYGANVLAGEGEDYREILEHYYPGTVIAGE